ncbi:hypothetical protein N9X05_03150, partial [Paracoccaceae bacterium]|nr:hypothetical protein [Paracoccaceae bacterium]
FRIKVAWAFNHSTRQFSVSKGLLCLIATFDLLDHGLRAPYPRAPRVGPRALSISVVIYSGVILFGNCIAIHASISS